MLSELHIKNIAVIEEASIEFEPGLNVLTGETGAGKSIVIDALGAVIGTRVGRDMLRTGAEKGLVTAVFRSREASRWLDENDIDVDDDDIIIQRRITADGKNSCRVCGQPITVAQLKELGTFLLDIHGQNDGRLLMDERNHLGYLDSYGDYQDLLKKFHGEYRTCSEIYQKIKRLNMDEAERQHRQELLRATIQELTDANLISGEEAEKTERRDLLHNSEKISEYLNTAYDDITGAEINALDLAGDAENLLAKAGMMSEEMERVSEIVREAENLLNDAAERLADFRTSLDYSPQEYDELESRLSFLRRLQRKYMTDEEGLIQKLETSKKELEELEFSHDISEKLQLELESQIQICRDLALELSERRRQTALELEASIERELRDLNMPSVRFKVQIDPVSKRYGFDKNGGDSVAFLMSANAGEKMDRISKVASGGELSRIMLAMKNVFAQNDIVETMVFDEIDAGISGIAAQRVGEKLSDVADHKQVICVTHLSQIAVMGDSHFRIEKSEAEGRTFTNINKLNMEDRKWEIARLHGGVHITDLTLASAQDQLDASLDYKRKHRSNKEN
ncbi:MAG: DNA repair protein RecN [Oscillospiraceae bacterium]|nr:DNA repair protein RecN [Oscillospiraceae bacterium]